MKIWHNCRLWRFVLCTNLCFIISSVSVFAEQLYRASEISLTKTLVWGPGLRSDVVLPARYFFIQAVDSAGSNFTDSLGEGAFTAQLTSSDNGRAFARMQVLDRHDGSYIVRYRLIQSYRDLRINVLFQGKHVANSPYMLNGDIHHELCNCPQSSLLEWMEMMQCPKTYEQIKNDLEPFKVIDMKKVQKEAITRFSNRGSHSLCHYVIKDNKIYRETHGEHVGFKMFMDELLLSMTRKVVLPDIEFLLNLGDWPLEFKKASENPLPMLSWCGSDETRDIVLPTYDMVQSTLETMNRVTLDLLSVQAETGPKWLNKTSVAFWRGRDSRQERLDLVKMSHKYPDIIDARLTRMFFFKHTEDLGKMAEHISFFDFFKYKYQINLDGTVAAYRLPYLLGGDSLVFKQDSHYYEYFYKQLRPYEHYVPIKADLSDLLKQIQWAKDNDQQAQLIARNAQTFVRDNLMATDVYCYHAVLFHEYEKLLLSKPQVRDSMDFVQQPSGNEARCDCQRFKKKTEL